MYEDNVIDLNSTMTTREAGEVLGLTVNGVLAAIMRGNIKAHKKGIWLIPKSEVERYAVERRPRGRPKKTTRKGESKCITSKVT